MKIYSWNMLFRNKELDRAFEFIRTTDFDIFCLQEVPADFLTRLKTLPYHCAFTIDTERIDRGITQLYLVTLSRYPITKQDVVHFPGYWTQWPWRTRLFVHLMRPFHFTKTKNRQGFFVEITAQDTIFQVFNLHLVLAHPDLRLMEFEHALAERKRSYPGIVCGDFNILESPKITLLNWLLGGRISDTIFWMRERIRIEKSFASHELKNPLRGKNTHPLSRSQLDHILVSNSVSIKDAQVIPNRIGSDHHPIRAEVVIDPSTPS